MFNHYFLYAFPNFQIKIEEIKTRTESAKNKQSERVLNFKTTIQTTPTAIKSKSMMKVIINAFFEISIRYPPINFDSVIITQLFSNFHSFSKLIPIF